MGPMKLRAGPAAPALKKGAGSRRVVGGQADEQHQRQRERDEPQELRRAASTRRRVARHQTSITTGMTIGRRCVRLRKKRRSSARTRSRVSAGRSAPRAAAPPALHHQPARASSMRSARARRSPRSRGSRSPAATRSRPGLLVEHDHRHHDALATRGGGGRAPRPPPAPSTPERSSSMRPARHARLLARARPRPKRQHVAVLGHAARGRRAGPACAARRACCASMRYSPWMGTR